MACPPLGACGDGFGREVLAEAPPEEEVPPVLVVPRLLLLVPLPPPLLVRPLLARPPVPGVRDVPRPRFGGVGTCWLASPVKFSSWSRKSNSSGVGAEGAAVPALGPWEVGPRVTSRGTYTLLVR